GCPMRSASLLSFVGFFLVAIPFSLSSEPSKYAKEAKWARKLVLDYLEASMWEGYVPNEKDLQVTPSALLHPEVVKYEKIASTDSSGYRLLRYTRPRIMSAEVAPDGSEVIRRGVLEGKMDPAGEKRYPDADITFRVAREAGGGPWSIRFMRLTEQPPVKQ